MTNAMVMCAGNSKLCKQLGYPKCLCKIGKERIIERQIRLLTEVGMEAIYVTVGHQQCKVIDCLNRLNNDKVFAVPVDWWWVEEQRHYGSLYSAWQLKDFWNDTIILLGDLVYSKDALIEMLNAPMTKYGFQLLLCDEKGTKWTPHEPFGVCMNKNGAEYLKSIKEPIYASINPNKGYTLKDLSTCLLWWHLEWKDGKKYHFTPEGFVQDVDGVEGLELAKKRVEEMG